MFWVDGCEAKSIALDDRGLHYGDGCFTTALVIAGEVDNMMAHYQRMQQACSALLITQVDWVRWLEEVKAFAQRIQEGVLKAIITRGSGGRGYSIEGNFTPRRIFSVAPWPSHYLQQRAQGIILALSPIRLGLNPALAGIKHLNRLEQVLIKAHLAQTEADEAVVLDTEDCLVECSAANLFWRKGLEVFTPSLHSSGVKGVMRQRIIQLLAKSPYQLQEVSQPVTALLEADEVIICNSLLPVVPVTVLILTMKHQYSSRQMADYLLPKCLLPIK